MVELFPSECLVGMFKGFVEEGLEFRAEIVSPYQTDRSLSPRIGQFLLVELDNPEEAALGRVTRFFPVGLMAGREGDEYLAEIHRSRSDVPAELKERRLRYSVKVRLLGGLRQDPGPDGELQFVPTSRRLPHLGARVATPSARVLEFLCSLSSQTDDAQPIGVYALGEAIFNGGASVEPAFLEPRSPLLEVRFDARSLISKRTFVFARAGYGKSNTLKLLIAQLYAGGPPRDASKRPIGMLVLDPEGEYFWPDEDNRPGLCNVAGLKDHIAVFTDRTPRSPYYSGWRVGGVRLDLRDLPASDVVSLCVAAERQDQQNINKLRTLRRDRWRRLVDYITEHGHSADEQQILDIGGWPNSAIVEAQAIRSNLTTIINRLHDPDGALQKEILGLLAKGMIVIVDLSLLSGSIGLQMSGLLLKKIFDHNQRSFTSTTDELGLVPVVAVLEEAQSVLGPRADDDSPFVAWAKEGRKYGLGAVMVTQQPGSMAPQLLSQGDNFFAFHLLSAHDLKTLQHHNAHFADDILAAIMNEPINGNCYFWSAPHQPFVLSARITDFAQVATDFPDAAAADQPADVPAARIDTEHQNARQQIAETARSVLTAEHSDGVDLYYLPGQRPSTDSQPETAACYKPRLSAQVAKRLEPDLLRRFASTSQDGTAWIRDEALADALNDAAIPVRVARFLRNDKEGDYYIMALSTLGTSPALRSGLEPLPPPANRQPG